MNANLHEIENQLNPLYFEINLLKFRLGEAVPEIRRQYRDQVSDLTCQYHQVEKELNNLKGTSEDIPQDQLNLAQQDLHKLQENFDRVGQWIYLETANQVCSYY